MAARAVDALKLLGLPIGQARPRGGLWTPSRARPDLALPRRPILLDAFCGRGGAAVGYYAAGWDIVGVDLHPQPLYPFPVIRADAVTFTRDHGHLFDGIAGSPPCQGYSHLAQLTTADYPRLIAPFREACQAAGVPYVIENVEGARSELHDPVTMCMADWGRRLYRHRLFESPIPLPQAPHQPHVWPQAKLGRPAGPGEMYVAVGNFPQIDDVRAQMEMPWSDRRGIAESVPPVFTNQIGRILYARLIDTENGLDTSAAPESSAA